MICSRREVSRGGQQGWTPENSALGILSEELMANEPERWTQDRSAQRPALRTKRGRGCLCAPDGGTRGE